MNKTDYRVKIKDLASEETWTTTITIYDWMIAQKGSLERCIWLIAIGEDSDSLELVDFWAIN